MAAPAESPTAARVRGLVESRPFHAAVVLVILINAAIIGAGTYPLDPAPAAVLGAMERGCVAFFLVEIVLRFLARRSTGAFLRDGWNLFDTVVVLAALAPATGGIAPLLRVLRVFRVLRLVEALPELRLIVSVLVRSVISMKYVTLLAGILFYVYAVTGVKLFGAPGHPLHSSFATIHEACFTLFRILTGDDWSQLRYDLAAAGVPVAAFTAYQVSWIVVATFLLVNLIVGAVINNYQRVQEIEQHRQEAPDPSDARLRALLSEMHAILALRAVRPGTGAAPTRRPPAAAPVDA